MKIWRDVYTYRDEGVCISPWALVANERYDVYDSLIKRLVFMVHNRPHSHSIYGRLILFILYTIVSYPPYHNTNTKVSPSLPFLPFISQRGKLSILSNIENYPAPHLHPRTIIPPPSSLGSYLYIPYIYLQEL